MIVSENPRIELINDDGEKALNQMDENQFGLAIIDPPTGQNEGKKHASRPKIRRQKNGTILNIKSNHKVKEWDSSPPDQNYFDLLFNVSKRHIIMCESHLSFRQKVLSPGRIVWNLLRNNDFSDCHIMWTNCINHTDYFEFMWNGMHQGEGINIRRQKGDKSKNQKRIHPSEKPIDVYKWLLKNYSKPGDKILDTHGGSLRIAIACYDLGFDLVCFEKDKDYYKDGVHEFLTHKKQLSLFSPEEKREYGEQLKIE